MTNAKVVIRQRCNNSLLDYIGHPGQCSRKTVINRSEGFLGLDGACLYVSSDSEQAPGECHGGMLQIESLQQALPEASPVDFGKSQG